MQFQCPPPIACSREHCDGVAIFGFRKSDHFEYVCSTSPASRGIFISNPETAKTSLFMHLSRILDAVFSRSHSHQSHHASFCSFAGWTSLFSHKRQNKQLAAKVLIVLVWHIECVEYLHHFTFHLNAKLVHTFSIQSCFFSFASLCAAPFPDWDLSKQKIYCFCPRLY